MKILEHALIYYSTNYGNIGFYPQQVDNKPRTEWQEGWNACASQLTKNMIMVMDWFENINQSDKDNILKLIGEGEINLHVNREEKKVSLEINLNDSFVYACSDSEEVTIEEIQMLLKCLDKYGEYGHLAFASIKRKEKPLIEHIEIMKKNKWWDEELEKLPLNKCNIDTPRW